jgi:flagellar secretion chaperone FliS
MNHNSSDSYLVSDVMTATPPKLHLMLLNAAIKEARRAQKHLQDNEDEKARKSIMHARNIIGGILAGMDYEAKAELIGKVAGVYLFIYQALAQAELNKDLNKLDEALRILEIERDTWRQVCEKLVASTGKQSAPNAGHAPIAPNIFSNGETPPDSSHTSFSLEA